MERRVLISTSFFGDANAAPLVRLESAGLVVVPNPFGRRLTRQEVTELLADERVQGVIAGLEPLDRGVLASSSLRVVSRVGSGVSNVDLDAASELGIAVRSTPASPTAAVAELTVGAMISLLRMIPVMDRALRERRWEKRLGGQIEGRTVAIIGFGRIGRRVSELLAPFRPSIVVVDPYVPAEEVAPLPQVSLDEAIAVADIVTIHSSGEELLFGPDEIPRMRSGAYLLNAARGGLVDEAALVAALCEGHLTGAWLDALPQEPYDGPLCDLPNVILTPHVGSYTTECRVKMEMEAVENLLDSLDEAERAAS
ncbi:MAG: NAD(P)-dependent oxidoreductase [Gemmatimonadota bacterium]